MYVREKRQRRGDRTYSYYQLVQGVREDGRVRQVVIKHLGAWPDWKSADRHARRMGILCCVQGCGSRAGGSVLDIKWSGGNRAKFCLEHERVVRDRNKMNGSDYEDGTLFYYPLYEV